MARAMDSEEISWSSSDDAASTVDERRPKLITNTKERLEKSLNDLKNISKVGKMGKFQILAEIHSSEDEIVFSQGTESPDKNTGDALLGQISPILVFKGKRKRSTPASRNLSTEKQSSTEKKAKLIEEVTSPIIPCTYPRRNIQQTKNKVIKTLFPISDENEIVSSQLLEDSIVKEGERQEITMHSMISDSESPKKRRIKLPVNSLANRLQKLIKKQNSSLNMWKHERYMAERKGFELPAVQEDDVLLLRINDCSRAFGQILLQCSNQDRHNTNKYTVAMNRNAIKSITVCLGQNLKIHKPYKVYEIDLFGMLTNVVVNVCKYEILKPD